MTDHKFEPFQRVLVRDEKDHKWKIDFFSHNDGYISLPFCCMRKDWRYCIPYTEETAHLLGTSKPYEPPKPPVEYEWGQNVEVPCGTGDWEEAIYIHATSSGTHVCTPRRLKGALSFYTLIRPMPDDTAAHLDAKP